MYIVSLVNINSYVYPTSKQKSQLIGVSIEGNQISQSDKANFDSKTAETKKQQEGHSSSVGEASPVVVVDQPSYNLKTNTKSSTVDDFAARSRPGKSV